MTRTYVSETVGQQGIYDLLSKIFDFTSPQPLELIQRLSADGQAAASDLQELFDSGLLMANNEEVAMSTAGQKATLLLRALNDAEDMTDVFGKLSTLFPSMQQYQLIQGDVTQFVVDTLNTRRDFIRLYICSPWIRLRDPYFSRFSAAVEAARLVYPQLQIFVVTLPLDRYNDRTAIQTLKNLQSLGATLLTHRKLHAKLYISEPGPQGGTHYAVFGSENLTGANQIELGVKVENENQMIGRLTQFFTDLEQDSTLLGAII